MPAENYLNEFQKYFYKDIQCIQNKDVCIVNTKWTLRPRLKCILSFCLGGQTLTFGSPNPHGQLTSTCSPGLHNESTLVGC